MSNHALKVCGVGTGHIGLPLAAVTLLRDATARERYAAAGRTCVESNHNWNRLLPRLEDPLVGGDQLAAAVARPSSH